jgi:hypothetical protein
MYLDKIFGILMYPDSIIFTLIDIVDKSIWGVVLFT